ncbi:hypothetical protein [Limnoglobus roseus]|uniref:Uncharacterized protein n=1 Tax=Limnoglobus roseus TaxID=2598579 RepID=A0A5C1AHD5_9BACT|nr:hypothetical protein [Limnoglobus roseus]QEL18641.1 hypothetical protein PX52LOC_05674 [Limnoglobus roseus]
MTTANEWTGKGDVAEQAGDEPAAQACHKRAATLHSQAGEWEAAISAGLRAVDSLLREAKTNGGLAWVAGETLRHVEDATCPWQRERVSEVVHNAVLAKRDEIDAAKDAWRARFAEVPPAVTAEALRGLGDALGGALMAGGYAEIDLGLAAKGRRATANDDGRLVSLSHGYDE